MKHVTFIEQTNDLQSAAQTAAPRPNASWIKMGPHPEFDEVFEIQAEAVL